MARDSDCRVACGSSVVTDPCEGHISVMIPNKTYAGVAWFLKAIGSPARPEEQITAILRGSTYERLRS